jgi:two-component system phosphate regulon sensor histidine kinase PhoR
LTFSRRLLLGTVVVLLVTVAVLVIAADRWLRADLERNVATTLTDQARLVVATLPADSLEWPDYSRRAGWAGRVRITLIDGAGRVRADTDVPDAELPQVENHSTRPEVTGALRGERGTDTRRSTTTSTEFMYVAVRGGPGIVRVAMPLDQVDRAVGAAQRSVVLAALLALLLGAPLAWLAGRSVARPLTEAAEAARTIASGGTPRFPRSGIPDMDGMVGALREMHEELDSRFEALSRKQAESAALVNAMVEGVLSSDGRGQVLTANPAARRLLGYGADQSLPALQVLFHQKAARAAVEATLRGETVPDREVLIDERICLLSARPLPEGGAVLVLHDLTDIRRLETIRRDFVANVSHELKTPLTSISGYAETLLADRSDETTTRKFLETILANARRMQRLVDDQLDLSRVESGSWRPAPRLLPTEAALQDAWTGTATPDGPPHHFRVAVTRGAESLRVDPDAFRQVLANLYDNARRYTPPGEAITALAVPDRAGIRISVQDEGSGISSDHLPRIFERFYRADPSRSRARGGTGLGLAIVKHMVEAHGGRVWAESELGRGTTIHCWLPNAG